MYSCLVTTLRYILRLAGIFAVYRTWVCSRGHLAEFRRCTLEKETRRKSERVTWRALGRRVIVINEVKIEAESRNGFVARAASENSYLPVSELRHSQ